MVFFLVAITHVENMCVRISKLTLSSVKHLPVCPTTRSIDQPTVIKQKKNSLFRGFTSILLAFSILNGYFRMDWRLILTVQKFRIKTTATKTARTKKTHSFTHTHFKNVYGKYLISFSFGFVIKIATIEK